MRRVATWSVALLLLPTITLAASYPTRNVEIVVSYGPGGSTDIVARIVAQALQERLGQSFVVVNRPGASGTIGIGQAMRAAPDGYTLCVGYTAETVVVPQISAAAKYSVLDDFEPVAITGLVPVVLTVSKNIKADTLKDFIAEVRANPGKYTYGGGHGSPPHIMGAWMNKVRNLDVRHVPYRGGAQAVNDMVGGHIDIFYGGIAVSKAAIDSGTVRALAISGDARSAAVPGIPTFKEAGVPEFDLASWTVLLAPKGTPADVTGVLRKETLAALDDPKVRDALARQGVEKGGTQDVRAFLKDEYERYGRVVRTLGIVMGQRSLAVRQARFTSPRWGEVAERSEAGEGVMACRESLAPSPGALRAPDLSPTGRGEECPRHAPGLKPITL